MTTPDWLTALAEKAAKATLPRSGGYAPNQIMLDPEAIAALVDCAKALQSAVKDIETLTDFGYGNLHPNDFRIRDLRAALARLDACAAGRP